jgi:toluene monooxygenase system ferredoxin subunit
MFERVCKAETIDEGGMRLVIANAQLIIPALMVSQAQVSSARQHAADEADWDGTVLTCPKHRWTWDSRPAS